MWEFIAKLLASLLKAKEEIKPVPAKVPVIPAPAIIGSDGEEKFFNSIKPLFKGRFKQSQVDGLNTLLRATADLPRSYRAYILATTFHETAFTMQPIREYGAGRGRPYGKKDETGKAPYGRGYVQLTWRDNYIRADSELGLNGALAANYDLALNPEIAAKILVEGMIEGWFTTHKLRDHLPGNYHTARKIVNGMDKAAEIAGYAEQFEKALFLSNDYRG